MLATELLAALEMANGTAGLAWPGWCQCHRYLLCQVKLFAAATRDLYRTRSKRLREIWGETNRATYLRTARRNWTENKPRLTTVPRHMDIRSFTDN